MFTESADLYDMLYSTLKDYEGEAQTLAQVLRRANPECRTVLDVGCGTGEHARLLAADGFLVDGVDLDPAFVRIASAKHPAGRFHVADMADFHLEKRYDAVTCLFSSIAYLRTLDRVGSALKCFREHLAPGGVVVVEPWLPPGRLDLGRVVRNTVENEGVRVTRVSRVEVAGSLCRLYFDYEITDATSTRRASEIHELGLFTPAEMLDAFNDAGLEAEHDPLGLTDRGLFVARVAAAAV